MTELQKSYELFKATNIYPNIEFNDENHVSLMISSLALDTLLDMAYNKGLESAMDAVNLETEKLRREANGGKFEVNLKEICDCIEKEKV